MMGQPVTERSEIVQRHGMVELRTVRGGAVLRCVTDTALNEPTDAPVLLPNELSIRQH